MFARLLVAIDFSVSSDTALEYARIWVRIFSRARADRDVRALARQFFVDAR